MKEKIHNAVFQKFLQANGLKKTDIARYLGVSNAFITQLCQGQRDIPYEKFALIKANPNWDTSMFVSEGEMLNSESVAIRTDDKYEIPFYDINVTASFTESFNDIREEVQYFISYPPLNDCTAAFPVYGESMEPDFFAGEIILVKEITNVDSMLWGEPYLIITNANCDNLRTIKNVYLSQDRTKFILRASNPRYAGDTIIDRNDVLKIFIVKGKINRRQL